jgi:hypothetical protein
VAPAVPRAARPAWEYKVIQRFRDFGGDPGFTGNNREYGMAQEWSVWNEDGRALATRPIDMVPKLAQLGADGWELVTVITKSNNARAVGTNGDLGLAMNGVTTEDMWVFKRPK